MICTTKPYAGDAAIAALKPRMVQYSSVDQDSDQCSSVQSERAYGRTGMPGVPRPVDGTPNEG